MLFGVELQCVKIWFVFHLGNVCEYMQLLLEIPYMGDDSVDLSGDVGAVGRILMHAPDEDLAEPALFIPGANGPNQPDSGPSKRAPDAAGPSENAVKASVDDKRLLPDSEAAKDLAGPSADADGSMHDGAGPSEAVATGGRDSNGGKPNGQLASGSRRGSKARRSCSGVDGESGKQKEASEKLLEDDDIEEVSEEYVKSEDESEGGSEGGPVGKKRKRKAAKRSGKDGSDGSLDEGTQEVKCGFVIDLKGVMFSANVVQMPCTALVVHVGDTQAKVLFSDLYLSLRTQNCHCIRCLFYWKSTASHRSQLWFTLCVPQLFVENGWQTTQR